MRKIQREYQEKYRHLCFYEEKNYIWRDIRGERYLNRLNRGYTKILTAWEKFSKNFKMPKTKKKIKKHQKSSNRQNSNIVVAIICGITIIFAVFRLKEGFIILPGLSGRFWVGYSSTGDKFAAKWWIFVRIVLNQNMNF